MAVHPRTARFPRTYPLEVHRKVHHDGASDVAVHHVRDLHASRVVSGGESLRAREGHGGGQLGTRHPAKGMKI